MAKHIVSRPDWLKTLRIHDIYSVSGCISENFGDYIRYWKHNGYWLFDSPKIIVDVAEEHYLNLENTKLFYYEVYELEYDEHEKSWQTFTPESSFEIHVYQPDVKTLEGYDVVTFSNGSSPECSPLSCNSLAAVLETNKHCLLKSFDRAKEYLEKGSFNNSEPGPFRIFAVYFTNWP